MGYIPVRHALEWLDITGFKSFVVKYNKYQKMNSQNLKNCKANALKDNNYEQIENFIEYEAYIKNSYFSEVVRFVSYMIDIMDGCDIK